MADTKKKRSSITEILRLLAAIWVLLYHCFPDVIHGYLGVEFFFMLSGYFFLQSFSKAQSRSFFKELAIFNWRRIKPILPILLICLPFSVYHYISTFNGVFNDSIFGYLWFIPHLLIVLSFYFILRKVIKNNMFFMIFTGIVFLACIMLIMFNITFFGLVRGLAMVGAGILLSYIPKFKETSFAKISIPLFCLLIVAMVVLMEFLNISSICFYGLFAIVLLPCLLYFSAQSGFSNEIVNRICSINFGIYAFQEVARFVIGFLNWGILGFCLIAIGLAISEKLIKYSLKITKKRE